MSPVATTLGAVFLLALATLACGAGTLRLKHDSAALVWPDVALSRSGPGALLLEGNLAVAELIIDGEAYVVEVSEGGGHSVRVRVLTSVVRQDRGRVPALTGIALHTPALLSPASPFSQSVSQSVLNRP